MWLDIPKLPKELALYTVFHPEAIRRVGKMQMQDEKQRQSNKKLQSTVSRKVRYKRKVYPSLNEAARQHNISSFTIKYRCEQKIKGWAWA